MSKNSSKKIDILSTVLALVGIGIVISLLADLIKDVRKNTSSDVVSEEGKEILSDKEKRKKLQTAIDHYHEKGNWDLLHKVAD